MRSRAELRRALEWGARAALVALIALALWRALHETAPGREQRAATPGTLPRVLRDATTSARVGSIALALDSLPSREGRAWLSALRRAGVNVRWRGDVPALALDAERVREPDAR